MKDLFTNPLFWTFLIVTLLIFLNYICRKPESKTYKCEECKYFKWNKIDEPCIWCDNGEKFVKSELDGQEDFDG